MTPNEVPEALKETEKLKDDLFSLRMNAASKERSDNWSLEQLEKVLKSTKNNAARNLKLSLLKLCNLTKLKQEYPEILQLSNITSIYKSKGRKDDLNSDRGIFNVVKI